MGGPEVRQDGTTGKFLGRWEVSGGRRARRAVPLRRPAEKLKAQLEANKFGCRTFERRALKEARFGSAVRSVERYRGTNHAANAGMQATAKRRYTRTQRR